MARIELRYCTITLRDGLALARNGILPSARSTVAPTQGAATLAVDSVNIPRARLPQKIPVGARFTLSSELNTPVHIVTDRVQGTGGVDADQSITFGGSPTGGTFTLTYSDASGVYTTQPIPWNAGNWYVQAALELLAPLSDNITVAGSNGAWTVTFNNNLADTDVSELTADATLLTSLTTATVTIAIVNAGLAATLADNTSSITFTPPLVAAAAGGYAAEDILSFQSQELSIKIGEGNCTYVEKMEYKYDLERGNLDAVREGNEVPLDVKFEAVYEHITTGTDETIAPLDALKGIGGASEWVTSGADPCEPYATEIEINYTPPCSGQDQELTIFPDFRRDQFDIDYNKAMISCTGKCNVTTPITSRVPQTSI